MSGQARRVRARHVTTTAAALLALGLLGACSEEPTQQASDIVADAQAADYEADQAQSQQVRAAYRDLPQPTTGVVQISGNRGSLTPSEVFRFNQTGTATDVRMSFDGEDAAFSALCRGEIDIVDSSRTVSEEELEACRSVGLELVQLQVASDAIVVAIQNESDVGGDCLSTAQVREIYRAGSPVTNWAQLGDGYDEVPLEVAGPNPENNAFGFFGQYVLDAPEPSMTNLRSDYRAFDTDQGSRLFVVGRDRDELLADQLRDRTRERDLAKEELDTWYQVVNDAKAELDEALRQRQKGIRDQRPPADQRADQVRQDRAFEALSVAQVRMRELEARKRELSVLYQRSADARERLMDSRGNVAYFRFSYYELFEEQLRPFEVTLPDGERSCVFPSQQTITSGQYPLARRLLLTTTLRSLERTEVEEFLLHYLDNAEEQAAEARLVPVPAGDVAAQRDWVSGQEEPVLVTFESTPVLDSEGEQTAPILQPAR